MRTSETTTKTKQRIKGTSGGSQIKWNYIHTYIYTRYTIIDGVTMMGSGILYTDNDYPSRTISIIKQF